MYVITDGPVTFSAGLVHIGGSSLCRQSGGGRDIGGNSRFNARYLEIFVSGTSRFSDADMKVVVMRYLLPLSEKRRKALKASLVVRCCNM